jgi:hypothetical protein
MVTQQVLPLPQGVQHFVEPLLSVHVSTGVWSCDWCSGPLMGALLGTSTIERARVDVQTAVAIELRRSFMGAP